MAKGGLLALLKWVWSLLSRGTGSRVVSAGVGKAGEAAGGTNLPGDGKACICSRRFPHFRHWLAFIFSHELCRYPSTRTHSSSMLTKCGAIPAKFKGGERELGTGGMSGGERHLHLLLGLALGREAVRQSRPRGQPSTHPTVDPSVP